MDPRLQALAGEQQGVLAAREAHARGLTDADLRAALRAGDIVRVRRGAYVAGSRWADADPWHRFRLSALAVARSRPGDALSHHAALAVHGLPLWGHDPGRIDLVSGVRQGVRRSGLWVHPSRNEDRCVVDGVEVVSMSRAVVRTALTMGRDCAVVAGDAALHRGLVTRAQLIDEVAMVTPHEGRGRALEAVLPTDESSESVGESRTRLVLDDLGLAYETQVVIRDRYGFFVARVDFLVQGVVVEFDGRVKYERVPDEAERAGQTPLDPGQVLWAEKQREDRIRRRGHPVERVIWGELERPGLIGARIRQAAAQAPTPAATHRAAADVDGYTRRA